MDLMTHIAMNLKKVPAPPPKYYEVRQNGVVIYRNTSVKLCQWWKKENGFLTSTIHSIR